MPLQIAVVPVIVPSSYPDHLKCRTSRSLRRLAGFGFIGTFYVTPMVHYWVEILEWLSRRPFAQQWILNGPGGKGEKSQGVRRALLQIFVDQLIGTNQNQNR